MNPDRAAALSRHEISHSCPRVGTEPSQSAQRGGANRSFPVGETRTLPPGGAPNVRNRGRPHTSCYSYVHVRSTFVREDGDGSASAPGNYRSARDRGPPPRRPRRSRLVQVVGAVVYQPGDAAGDDQLGHADHRAARSRAEPAHEPARARVGDPRLHDRLDRARAERRPAVGPVRTQEGVHRRFPRVRARLARRRFRGQRHAS